MRVTRMALTWLCVVALLGATHLARGQGTEAPDEGAQPADEQVAPPAGEQVQMIEMVVGDHTVRGRLLGETESAITIEGPGGGAVAYPRDAVLGVRRSVVPASAYYEERGDLHRERARTADDPAAEFRKARLDYQKALAEAASEEQRAQLTAKLQAVAADREDRQKEAVQQENLAKARHEAELARLNAELSKARLDALQEQAREVLALREDLRRAQQQIRFLTDLTDRLKRKVDDLEDDLEGVTRGSGPFATVRAHEDLARSVSTLERRMDRLERQLERR